MTGKLVLAGGINGDNYIWMSDATPTEDDLNGNSSFEMFVDQTDTEQSVQKIPVADTEYLVDDLLTAYGFLIAEKDNVVWEQYGITFPRKGIYFLHNDGEYGYYHTQKITIPGYNLSGGSDPITPDMIGAAPAGHGLGELAPKITTLAELDAFCTNGWREVALSESGEAFYPGAWYFHTGIISCVASEEISVQTYIDFMMGWELRRVGYYVEEYGWGEWEWITPSMENGNWFLTNEWFEQRATFVSRVDIGAFPSTGYKDVSLGNINSDYYFGLGKVLDIKLFAIKDDSGEVHQVNTNNVVVIPQSNVVRVSENISGYTGMLLIKIASKYLGEV